MKTLFTYSCQILSSSPKTDSRVRSFSYKLSAFTFALLLLLLFGGGVAALAQQVDPLTVTTDGKVGINTPTPTNKLSVMGDSDFFGKVGIGTFKPLSALSISSVTKQANQPGQEIGQLTFVGFNRPKASASILAQSPGWDDASHLIFNTSEGGNGPQERLRITSSGSVGIGTPAPSAMFDVNGKILLWNADGRNYFKDIGKNDGKGLRVGELWGQYGVFAETGSGALGGADGVTLQNGALTVNGAGNIGIGTTNATRGKVEIIGAASFSSFPGTTGYLQQSTNRFEVTNPSVRNGWVDLPIGRGINLYAGGVSVYADNAIAASMFVAFSDARLKHIQGRSDTARDLNTLMNIEVTDYSFVDSVTNGTRMQKKVTGQQVEKVFPQAVMTTIDVVPDIYQKATIKDGWVMLATNLKKGERVRLIGENQQGIHEVLEVAEGKFRTAFAAQDGLVFVYGREVNDARSVDYEAISMLNVSATQQIKKEKDEEVKALQEENAALRSQLASQEQRLSDLEAKDKAREERFAALEALVLAEDKHATRVTSLKKVE